MKYLVDFYHTSEYLAKAAEHSWTSQKVEWRQEQQQLLKQSKHQDVLDGLRKRLPIDFEKQQESKKSKRKSKERLSEEKVEETPVEKCYRYISNRQNNLDYKSAIEKTKETHPNAKSHEKKSFIGRRLLEK